LVGLSPTEHTSFILDTLPYGGFSPVRLQGRFIRRGLPVDCEFFASCSLRPPFVPLAIIVVTGSESGNARRWYTTVQVASAALPRGPSLRSGL
jgi:hypothetical protein